MSNIRNLFATIFLIPAMILGGIGWVIAHKTGREQIMIGLLKSVSKMGE